MLRETLSVDELVAVALDLEADDRERRPQLMGNFRGIVVDLSKGLVESRKKVIQLFRKVPCLFIPWRKADPPRKGMRSQSPHLTEERPHRSRRTLRH